MNATNSKIAVIGMGYVGLPLAVEFSKVIPTVGFDVLRSRVDELCAGFDRTLEVDQQALQKASNLLFTNKIEDIESCNFYIITVPTPIDDYKKPDLRPLIEASKTIGTILKKKDIVIYESTVYPGATEEVCVPILEKCSGLVFNKDFFCGYSPERINPGDKMHRISSIVKVTSGSTKETADIVDRLYKKIITAGTYKASSIKVAEAAKVIENTQRDVNIALVNELAILFSKLNINTEEVLNAAKTKWNFLPFQPGLVGGHCIGIDPYYLTHKALEIGYSPEIIIAGRKLNDSMGSHIINQINELMINHKIKMAGAQFLIMGLTFKENCPDVRNSKVFDLIFGLKDLGCSVDIYDPWVDKRKVREEFNITLVDEIQYGTYDGIIMAVPHDAFKSISIEEVRGYGKSNHIIYDIKYLFDPTEVDGRL